MLEWWRAVSGMDFEGARYAAFEGIARAARSYDPGKGASFGTFAYGHILGALRRSLPADDALGRAELEVREEIAPTEDEVIGSAELARLLWRVARTGGPAAVASAVYEAVGPRPSPEQERLLKEGLLEWHEVALVRFRPSSELAELVAAFDAAFSDEEREASRRLATARTMLDSALTRSLHHEGAMVRASDLAQILRAKEWGVSNRGLARAFGVSESTVRSWVRRARDAGIEPHDLRPEALTQLGWIMTARRGPRAGR